MYFLYELAIIFRICIIIINNKLVVFFLVILSVNNFSSRYSISKSVDHLVMCYVPIANCICVLYLTRFSMFTVVSLNVY